MRVLIASQYFPPEIHGPSARLHAFAAGLARRGHDVDVVCEVPSHPGGVVAPGYGGRMVDARTMDGFEVRYVWVRATPSKTARSRLINYATYAATATAIGAMRPRPEVVFASSPPLPVGNVGAALALRHRVPWVLDVRDLWPDAAVAVGEIEEGALLRVAAQVERRLYRSAAAITATTETFVEAIRARGGAGKVTLIRNGTNELFLQAGVEAPESALLGNPDERFIWTYAGNLGLAQGLEYAVEAAGELGQGFRLLLVGDGPRRDDLRRLADRLPAGAVDFVDRMAPERAAALMRASDALLVSLAPGLEGFVPSKLFDCCAMTRPVILAAAGEAANLASGADAAFCVAPGNSQAIAVAVRRLRDDAALRERLEAHGRAFAVANSREGGVGQLEQVLLGLVR